MSREELNINEMEQVSGGKFTFYNDENGQAKCDVTGYGTFTTYPTGVFSYMTLRNNNPGLSEAEYVDLCKQAGIIW